METVHRPPRTSVIPTCPTTTPMTSDLPPDAFLLGLRDDDPGAHEQLERYLERVEKQMQSRTSRLRLSENTRESVRSSTKLRFFKRARAFEYDLTTFNDKEHLLAHLCTIYLNLARRAASQRGQRTLVGDEVLEVLIDSVDAPDIDDVLETDAGTVDAIASTDEEELREDAYALARDTILRERVAKAVKAVPSALRDTREDTDVKPITKLEAYVKCLKRPEAKSRPVARDVAAGLGIVRVEGGVVVPDERAIANYRRQVRDKLAFELKDTFAESLPDSIRAEIRTSDAILPSGRGTNQLFDDWIADNYFQPQYGDGEQAR